MNLIEGLFDVGEYGSSGFKKNRSHEVAKGA